MSANSETTMSPAELLGTLDDAGGSLVHAQREGITTTVSYDQLVKARTAVAALIEREAALVAERDSADRYGWIDGPPPFPHGEEWFLADTDFGPAILRSLPEENSYDYTTADHTHILKEKVKRWMQLPESEFISYLSSGQILELRAERESLIAEREALAERVKALEADAARWTDIAGRFDRDTTLGCERVLEALGYPHEQPWLPLAEIVDAARAEATNV